MAKTMAELIQLQPIGIFHGERASKSAIPRQGVLSNQKGYIEFEKGFDHKLALSGLESMSHVWVIYHFHEAQSPAKPLVRPPRAPDKQVGLYATRAPYRPNPLGLTLAKIEKVENGRLYLALVDLLDKTPVLDLKPYVTESDQASNPKLGWIDEIEMWKFELSPLAERQSQWLHQNGLSEIYDVLESQLGTNPLQFNRKRIVRTQENQFVLSYRTWRFFLSIEEINRTSTVIKIYSGYTENDLLDSADPYQDKNFHKEYLKVFFEN